MPSIGGINTGGILIPSSTISSYNNSYGNNNTQNNNDLNLYQITVVYDDHSISVRPYNPYIKTNSITSNERYYPYNANISRFPKIEEFVELKPMPTPKSISQSSKSSKRTYGYIYAINTWNNLNANKISLADNSDEKTANFSVKNYQNSTNGFI